MSSLTVAYPREFYGRRSDKSPGIPFNPKHCAGEVKRGFDYVYQCKNKPGFGERQLFCPEHMTCKAKAVPDEQ